MASFQNLTLAIVLVFLLTVSGAAAELDRRGIEASDADRIDAWVAKALPDLLEIYRDLHAHPELSLEAAGRHQ